MDSIGRIFDPLSPKSKNIGFEFGDYAAQINWESGDHIALQLAGPAAKDRHRSSSRDVR
jgi:hypothetical protein